jgi:hypothetical protein
MISANGCIFLLIMAKIYVLQMLLDSAINFILILTLF